MRSLMNATQAFQLTITLAEGWLAKLRRFEATIGAAGAGRRGLANEWADSLLPNMQDLGHAGQVLQKATAEVAMSIDIVKRALGEARLDDAIIAIKQWDTYFEKLIEAVVGEGPRQSTVLPLAHIALKLGTQAINAALDIRYETIGTISASEIAFKALLASSENPWR